MELQKQHFKDQLPELTVNKLKSIIRKLNLEVEEQWQEENAIGTNALRVVFKGTDIGSNGKGMNKDYALASAYAELFERYQNGLLVSPFLEKNNYNFYYAPDEKWMSTNELIKENSGFLKFYFNYLEIEDKGIDEKVNQFKEINRLDYIIRGRNDEYLTMPFYNYKSKRIEYLPQNIYRIFYGSNGMCAGNTREEALVQGLSEIIERVVQKKIFLEKPYLPDIPEDYIKKYEEVYKMYKLLQNNERYTFILKDCSFGGKFPVAGLVIIEKNSGRYGIKLGCHPDYGIAMERTFTEAAQGQDIFEYVNRSFLDFQNKQVSDWKNIYNSYKVGKAQYPYQIFWEDKKENPFIECRDVSNMSNKEILHSWIEQFLEKGYDILIRDVSYLNFPSYHIIIPGLSEMLYPDTLYMRAINTRCLLSKYIEEDMNGIGFREVEYIVHLNDFFANNIFENTVSNFYSIVLREDIPCEEMGAGSLYFSSMCYFMLSNYEMASNKMKSILEGIEKYKKKVNEEDYSFYKAIYYYFSARCEFESHEQAIESLKIFFTSDIIERIDYLFEKKEKVLFIQYPSLEKYKKRNDARYYKLKDNYGRIVNALKDYQLKTLIKQEDLENVI